MTNKNIAKKEKAITITSVTTQYHTPPLLFDKQITHIFVKIKKFLICSFLNKSAKCPFFRHFVDRQSLPQRLNITENLQ